MLITIQYPRMKILETFVQFRETFIWHAEGFINKLKHSRTNKQFLKCITSLPVWKKHLWEGCLSQIVVQGDLILQFIYQIPDLVLIISVISNGIHFVYSADTTGTVDMHTAIITSLLSSICPRLCSTNTLIHKYLPHSKMIKQTIKQK